jgi:hypothetical protein
VIHEHPLGWDGDGNFATPAFPYAADSPRTPVEIEVPAEVLEAEALEGQTPGTFASPTTTDNQSAGFDLWIAQTSGETPWTDTSGAPLSEGEALYQSEKSAERGWTDYDNPGEVAARYKQ